MGNQYVIGIDYGTDTARAVVVDARTGEVVSTSVKAYPRWAKGLYCDPQANSWRQHPLDYLEVLEGTVREALAACGPGVARQVRGIALDATGTTSVFTDRQGVPLSLKPEFAENPDAMFVLWKDHTAVEEAEQINAACKESEVDYTMFEGGIYSSEWLWAKTLHIMRSSPEVAAAAYAVVEHCDWIPAMLTGVDDADKIVRSRCAAGHKAMWNARWGGLPPEEFFRKLDPGLVKFRYTSPTATADTPVGHLCPEWARRLGLSEDVVVAASAFDCHIGAVGANIKPGTLVRVIGTSACDVLVAPYEEVGDRCIRGILGQVDGSVLPGMVGLEAGQASFGDVYTMFRRMLEWPLRNLSGLEGAALEEACGKIIPALTAEAEKIPAEEGGMLATDWINGRRTPDTNQKVTGTLTGLTLASSAPRVYKALVEATAFGSRAIVERFREEGVTINEIVGIGGIALKSPFVMQTMSDVLGMPINVCRTDQACALGAAMFAATAAGLYPSVEEAAAAMESGFAMRYVPDPGKAALYDRRYKAYLSLCRFTENLEIK
ncbi:MAG: ribulokinase [Bacteroidales bacterium]|nr:ribulokinase [Bacteroidales bacterium]